MDVRERLRRLLLLVPYVAKHPGIPVETLALELGLTTEQLLQELDLLTLVGRPPFQPDDCIDIYVENGKVFVTLEQRLSAPPRMTAAEAAALAAAAHLLKPAGSETLGRALAKLEKVLPPGAAQRYREIGKKIDVRTEGPPELGPVAHAIAERRELVFEYFSPNRGAREARRIRPLELFSHRGQWYLSGYCLSREDARLFRLDRTHNLQVTDTLFEPLQLAAQRIPNPAATRDGVRVHFTEKAAPYVRERFGSDCHPSQLGGVEVTVAGDSPRWLTSWVLSFGGEARVLEPPEAVAIVARAAKVAMASEAASDFEVS